LASVIEPSVREEMEWSPDWTAFAMYLKTIEFLHAFYSGKMENSPQPTPVHQPRNNLMDELMGVFRF